MMRTKNWGRALLLGGALALAACSGSNGKDGANGSNGANGADGANGTNGTNGTNGVNGVTGKMSLTIDSVVTASGTSTVTFTIRPAALVCPGAVCSTNLSLLSQKTFYAQEFNATTGTFDTAKNFSYTGITFLGYSADGNGAQYTAKRTGVTWSPEASTSAFVYGYVATAAAVPVTNSPSSHYTLPGYVASASRVFGTIAYTSTVDVAGCERCHGAPYSKHGYRQARVAGLPDMVSCKVCHTDQRPGSDGGWYVKADDPASYDPDVWDTVKYAYTANIMNDTHNSHAFEFNYPQLMSNCVTCHKGKLNLILTDANFKPTVCKSCHPVTGVAGTETGRAPAMLTIWTNMSLNTTHASFLGSALYTLTDPAACNICHKASGIGKTFAQIHAGYENTTYASADAANAGTTFAASRKAQIDSVTYDPVSYVGTVYFSVAGVSTTSAVVVPTVVGSLYGYATKDFLVSGHGSAADGKRNLEFTAGSSSNGTRMVVAAGADAASFVATFNLSNWSSMITAGQVKRMEFGVLPSIGIDPTAVISTTTGNLAAAVTGVTATFDVSPTSTIALVSGQYGKDIVDANKCAACHDRLGWTFHSASYGSAGTVACRLCHAVVSAGSHLEMQSRSIDSYVHGLHRMQELDPNTFNLTDKVQALRYNDHVEGFYPNFAGALNCESCHNAGKYDVPDQGRSLPGVLSGTKTVTGRTGLGTYAAQITGPAARACGGCHRAAAINESDGNKLAAFVAHTNDFGSAVMDTTYLTTTAAYIEYAIGGATTNVAAPAGAQVEQCEICHSTSGTQHQTLFNVWRNGTK
jgi:hypothetical protein